MSSLMPARLRRRFLRASAAALVSAAGAAPAAAEPPSFPLDSPLPGRLEEQFLRALSGAEKFAGSDDPDPVPGSPEEAHLVRVWSGAKADMSATVRPTAVFERDARGEALAEPFRFSVTFEKEGFLLESAMLRDKFVRAAPRKQTRDTMRYFVKGSSGRNLFVLFPLAADPASASGVAVCVTDRRSEAAANARTQGAPPPTAFLPVLSSATFEATASVRGTFLSGMQRGLVRASVDVTPTLAPPALPTDRLLGKDPSVSLTYRAEGPPVITPVAGAGGTVGGILLTTVYHAAAGYRRSETLREQVWMAERPLTGVLESEVRKMARGADVRGGASCVLVIRNRSGERTYGREPLPESD